MESFIILSKDFRQTLQECYHIPVKEYRSLNQTMKRIDPRKTGSQVWVKLTRGFITDVGNTGELIFKFQKICLDFSSILEELLLIVVVCDFRLLNCGQGWTWYPNLS